MGLKLWWAVSTITLLVFVPPALGVDYANKVKLDRKDVYACAAQHLHIPGYAKNTADVTLTGIQVEGRVFDKEGHLLATKVVSVMAQELPPGESAAFDMEFVEITQPNFGKVGDIVLKVVQALPKP
ncbi:MAG: FxLYD domain-containing protein [Candidatus Methylomirabilales bacterium]